ncbi:hypothetical protein AB0A95_33380 [Micromonospora sp. NPDC049230]
MDQTNPGRPVATGVITLDGAFRRIPIDLIALAVGYRADRTASR